MKKIKLSDIENKHPFKVPDGYFDKLQQSIESTVDSGTTQVSLKKTPWITYLAAAIITLAIVALPLSQIIKKPQTTDILADISSDDILYYIDYFDIQEAEILESIDDNYEYIDMSTDISIDIELDEESIEMLYLEFGINEI